MDYSLRGAKVINKNNLKGIITFIVLFVRETFPVPQRAAAQTV